MIETLIHIVNFSLLAFGWAALMLSTPSMSLEWSGKVMTWPARYGLRLNMLALPFMVIQVFLSIGLLFNELLLVDLIMFILVLITWVLTFDMAMPLQERMEENGIQKAELKRLKRVNIYRTLCWCLIFLIALV